MASTKLRSQFDDQSVSQYGEADIHLIAVGMCGQILMLHVVTPPI
jgi:hypothetical protein